MRRAQEYVDDEIIRSRTPSTTSIFMPKSGGQFTGAVNTQRQRQRRVSTLVHKDAFSSPDQLQMGDRRYHGIHCSRASYPGYPSVELKSSSSSTNVQTLKVTNNGSQTILGVWSGWQGPQAVCIAIYGHREQRDVTLAKANDLIKGRLNTKSANKPSSSVTGRWLSLAVSRSRLTR